MEERIPVSDSLGSIGGGVAASFLASAAWNHKIDRHELAIERENELRNQIQNRRHSFIPIRAGLENAGKFRLVGFGANRDAGSGWLTSNDWMSTKSLGTLPQNAGSIPIPKHNQTDLRAEYLKGPSRSNASAIGIYHAPSQTHAGGGAAMQPHGGGSYSPTQTGAGAITPLQLPAPLSSSMNTSAIIASLTANQVLGDPRGAASVVSASSKGPVVANSSPASTTAPSITGTDVSGSGFAGAGASSMNANSLSTLQTNAISTTSSGGSATPGFSSPTPSQLTGGSNSAPLGQFPYFQLYTLDNNTGNVIFPGYEQLATLGGSVDLRAQVDGQPVSTYSWNTSGLTDATSISGTSTYDLTFDWTTNNPTPTTNSATLTVIDTNGNTTTYAFNNAQQLTSQTDALGGVVSYTYTADGQMASLTDPVGNVTSWAYDAAGRVTSQTNPLGTSYDVYNADSQLIKYTDNNGQVKTYAYNADGWKTTENWLNASGSAFWTETTTYNADGMITEVTNPSSTLTYTYNTDMLMASVSTAGTPGQPSVTLSYAYNAVNLISSVSDNIQSGDTTTYGYDAAFHLTSIAQTIGGSVGPQISIGYDSGGRLTSESRSTGSSSTQIDTTIGYNAANEITSILHQSYTPGGSGGTYSTINSYSYGYDSGGLLTTQTNNDGTFNYSYDKTNQLTGVTGPWNESFSYDLNGNRTMSGYTTGKDNEMLTDAAGNKYTYDANGNTTSMTTPSGDVWTYTWNYRNEMTGFSEKNSSGTVIASGTYTYDSLDRRIGVDETSGGTTTQTWIVYNGNSNTPYAQFNGSGTLLERYLAGPSYVPGVTGMVARTNASGVTDWYLTGKLGSVRDIINTSGTVIDHISYGAFGSIRAETSPSSGSQFKFDGMQFDTITGLYNDWHREYSSDDGRFTAVDPTLFEGKSFNLYSFSGNSSINFIDSNGFYTTSGESVNGNNLITPYMYENQIPFLKGSTNIYIGFVDPIAYSKQELIDYSMEQLKLVNQEIAKLQRDRQNQENREKLEYLNVQKNYFTNLVTYAKKIGTYNKRLTDIYIKTAFGHQGKDQFMGEPGVSQSISTGGQKVGRVTGRIGGDFENPGTYTVYIAPVFEDPVTHIPEFGPPDIVYITVGQTGNK